MRLLFPVWLIGCAAPVDGTLETVELDASAYDQTYTLSVFVPDEVGGPLDVVYLLDGDDWTVDTAAIVSELARDGRIQAPIVVGIGYGDLPNERGRDYTPAGPGIPDGHGEVEAFFGFVRDDLVPFVDESWDTRAERAGRVVIGHSFGGEASAWALLFEQETFGGFVPISPSLTFGEAVMFDHEADYAATHDDLDARVFLAAGELEAFGLAGLTDAFGQQLRDRDYPSLALRIELLANRIHAETFQPAAEAGLAFVLEQP